jgi:BirA family biotin operon repressor/biotin-[acetyl-CoA-carboxylase] ligase
MASGEPGCGSCNGDPALTHWPKGYGLLHFDELDSTNEEAKRLAKAGEAGPIWITAGKQTAGRGRRGRVWEAPEGNLSATLLIRPNRSAKECAQLSFAAALAVSDVLSHYVQGFDVRLKWPNDTLVDGRKIAGILLESETLTDSVTAWLAVGIGVNLVAFPPETEFPATALGALRIPPPSPKDAASALAEAFAKWYEAWRKEGFSPLRAAWLARAYGLGNQIRVRLAAEELTGVFRDLDETGALILDLPSGQTRTIAAGDVFF